MCRPVEAPSMICPHCHGPMAVQIGSELTVFVGCSRCAFEGQFLRSANDPPNQWRFEPLVNPTATQTRASEPIGELDALTIRINAARDAFGIPRHGGPPHG